MQSPVESQDVWVLQMGLNLNLTPQLVLNTSLGELRLEEHLESDNVMALFLARKVHVTKLATTQGFANVKVSELPLLCGLAWCRPRLTASAAGARRGRATGGRARQEAQPVGASTPPTTPAAWWCRRSKLV